jgi:hypothetical protein
MWAFRYALACALAVSVIAAESTPVKQAIVSHDGLCGNGVTCSGSMFGQCCGADGKCGSYVTLNRSIPYVLTIL